MAFFLSGATHKDADIYVMINAGWKALTFGIQPGQPGEWDRVIDTSLPPPTDFCEPGTEVKLRNREYVLSQRSVVVLVRCTKGPPEA